MKISSSHRAIWRNVAQQRQHVSYNTLSETLEVIQACREAHVSLIRMLDRLVEGGYLRRDGATLFKARFWFGGSCVLPAGEPDPGRVDDGTAVAGRVEVSGCSPTFVLHPKTIAKKVRE